MLLENPEPKLVVSLGIAGKRPDRGAEEIFRWAHGSDCRASLATRNGAKRNDVGLVQREVSLDADPRDPDVADRHRTLMLSKNDDRRGFDQITATVEIRHNSVLNVSRFHVIYPQCGTAPESMAFSVDCRVGLSSQSVT
jgi:hypothetical protein